MLTEKTYKLGVFYGIGTELTGKTMMKVRTRTGVDYLLQFKDYPDASRFLEWMQSLPVLPEAPVIIGKNTLLFNGNPLTIGKVLNIDLKVIPVY